MDGDDNKGSWFIVRIRTNVLLFFFLQQQNVGLGISNLYVLEVCLFFIRG